MKKIWIVICVLLGWYACSDDSGIPQISGIEQTTFTDSRDGKVYQCIIVNGKTWMAENLSYRMPLGSVDGCYTYEEKAVDTAQIEVSGELYAERINKALESGELVDTDGKIKRYITLVEGGGWTVEDFIVYIANFRPEIEQQLIDYQTEVKQLSIIQLINNSFQEAELANGKYSERFGYLYSHEAALKALPEGWSLPTDEDWKELEKALGMSSGDANREEEWRGDYEGLLLKEGEKGSGFNARMGGGKLYGAFPYKSQYDYVNANAYFWTDTKKVMNDSIHIAYVRKLSYTENRIFRGTSSLVKTAYSVRGIKK